MTTNSLFIFYLSQIDLFDIFRYEIASFQRLQIWFSAFFSDQSWINFENLEFQNYLFSERNYHILSQLGIFYFQSILCN